MDFLECGIPPKLGAWDKIPTKPPRNLCGPVIRALRKQRNLTLDRLSEQLENALEPTVALSVSPSHLAKMERQEKTVNDRQLWALSRLFNLPLEAFFPDGDGTGYGGKREGT